MEKVTITRVYTTDKNKDGVQFKNKQGKPFWKVGIQTQEYGDEWFSCLAFDQGDRVLSLKEGEEQLVVLSENNGFKNFKLPTKTDLLESRVERLEKNQKQIVQKLGLGVDQVKPKDSVDYPEDDINPEDIPF